VEPIAERIAAAKLWLISQPLGTSADSPRDLSYLATALYALRTVPTPTVRTIRADQYWRLYVNPDWLLSVGVPELGRELAHAIWHLLMDHAGRAVSIGIDRSGTEAWNRACDLTVTDTLAPDGSAPESIATAAIEARHADSRLRPARSAEDYYAIISGLPAQPAGGSSHKPDRDDDCGSACDGIARGSDLPPDSSVDYLDRAEADLIRERVAIDYLDAVKSRGATPGEALRWAKHLTEPTIAWEPLLARAVRRGVGWTSGRSQPTWSRPSRRQSVQPDVLQPGWRRPVPAVAMIIDTSASIDDRLLGKAMGEVEGALRGLGIAGASLTVIACDAAVGAVRRVRKATEASLVGGGGTDMRVGIKVASELRPRPDLIVVFTDGYTPWPNEPPPGAAVIAAMLGRRGESLPAPPRWATRVDCILDA
jgi:predicted metal-dependent peptidase